MNGKPIASYSCTALQGTNKTGALAPNEDGYYTMVVGALDCENSVGDVYRADPAKVLFDESHAFQRRIRDGSLYGETGHPRMQPGQNTRDFIARCMDVLETNVCCQFRRIWLEYGTVRDANGRPMLAIMAELIPAGPNGPALEKALRNPSQNVCFSIRSFTHNFTSGGRNYKDIKTIITFDWVLEPGIAIAKKWFSPALESREECILLPPMVEELIRAERYRRASGFENASVYSAESLVDDLGWQVNGARVIVPERAPVIIPPSASW